VPSIIEPPVVTFGPEVSADLSAALRREWLVTNGLGGYASGTLAGPNTRRYHGLLVAALAPPVERTVLVGGSIDWATYGGQRYPLSTHEYLDGTLDPRGDRLLSSFQLDGTLPVWTFGLGDALLERRVWMAYGANTTYVRYHLVRGSGPVQLSLMPLVTYRDFHKLARGWGWQPRVQTVEHGLEVHAWDAARPLHIFAPGAEVGAGDTWYWNFLHREERARGLDFASDLYVPGHFSATVEPGQSITMLLSVEDQPDLRAEQALGRERTRQRALLRRAHVLRSPSFIQQLVLAADQFLVSRDDGRTVIAGYHWFNDWGRDTMIALPGLTLVTGRADEAADVLRTFAQFVAEGMLPNNFPDQAGQTPGYNTVDATLWYVLAIDAYTRITRDHKLIRDLLPVLRDILEWHIRGTHYGIGVDATDGLLRAGAPGLQLTWMDAKVGDWVVTPRTGKPVEVQALWYNALRIVAAFDDRYAALAAQVHTSFLARFWRPDVGYLSDVVDGPGGDDLSLRPNQIFAVSLPFPLVDGTVAASVVRSVGRSLLTPLGLRSLAPREVAYRGDYSGDQVQRDGAYHQGPVWIWLIGAYIDAVARTTGSHADALGLLAAFAHHLRDAGLGSISELCDGDPPHLPHGCISQAWSVAEVLRSWHGLQH
jgi:predicted glycogen debranching enzyme